VTASSLLDAPSQVCGGCPRYAHIDDDALRWPTCELCRWPAVDLAEQHAWQCAACRHANVHGRARPRVAILRLRWPNLDPAVAQLPVERARFGYPALPHECRVRTQRTRKHGKGSIDWSRHNVGHGYVEQATVRAQEPPHYAIAVVDGRRVLLVGGDGAKPYPVGTGDDGIRSPALRDAMTRATRMHCACDEPAPCRHAQALYLTLALAHLSSRGMRQVQVGGQTITSNVRLAARAHEDGSPRGELVERDPEPKTQAPSGRSGAAAVPSPASRLPAAAAAPTLPRLRVVVLPPDSWPRSAQSQHGMGAASRAALRLPRLDSERSTAGRRVYRVPAQQGITKRAGQVVLWTDREPWLAGCTCPSKPGFCRHVAASVIVEQRAIERLIEGAVPLAS
jgi:hypothetical protein